MIRHRIAPIYVVVSLVLVILGACSPGPPDSYDWCYAFDFTDDNAFGVAYGTWQPGTGYVTDDLGRIVLSYGAAVSIYPNKVLISAARIDAGDISVAASGNVFGITGDVVETLPAALDNAQMGLAALSADTNSSAANVSVQASGRLAVTGIEIYGRFANPFGTSNCGDVIPTWTVPVQTNTPFPTLTLTPVPPTETLTLTPTPTGSFTPTNTPPATPTPCPFVINTAKYMPTNGTALTTALGDWLIDRDPATLTASTAGIKPSAWNIATEWSLDVEDGVANGLAGLGFNDGDWFDRVVITYGVFTGSSINVELEVDGVSTSKSPGGTYTGWTVITFTLPEPMQLSNETIFSLYPTGTCAGSCPGGSGNGIAPVYTQQLYRAASSCYGVTPTATPTPTITSTPLPTSTATLTGPTSTRTPNPTFTPAYTPSVTRTPSRTPIPIYVPPTALPATSTPIHSATPNQTLTAQWEGTVTESALTATATGTSVGVGGSGTGSLEGIGDASDNISGLAGVGSAVSAFLTNGMNSVAGWWGGIGTAFNEVNGAWVNTAAVSMPGTPLCLTAPMSSELCAIYYILTYTLLSGSVGALIVPTGTVVIDLYGVFLFIKLGRAIVTRITELVRS